MKALRPADQTDGSHQRPRAHLRRIRHGKELIGRTMHAQSLRKDRVFVELNCAAIPEDNIETELFGYRHGAAPAAAAQACPARSAAPLNALTAARSSSMKSRHEPQDAGQGPPRPRRTALLPVGASHPVHVDVRVIAATNKDLEEEIARGNFREDLFYGSTSSPSSCRRLRERKEDIRCSSKSSSPGSVRNTAAPASKWPTTPSRAAPIHWPGNVRELRNLIERVIILNPKAQRIERKHLPMLVYREQRESTKKERPEEFSTLLEAREAYERDYILKKIDECHGNVHPRRRRPRPRALPPLPQDESARRQRQGIISALPPARQHYPHRSMQPGPSCFNCPFASSHVSFVVASDPFSYPYVVPSSLKSVNASIRTRIHLHRGDRLRLVRTQNLNPERHNRARPYKQRKRIDRRSNCNRLSAMHPLIRSSSCTSRSQPADTPCVRSRPAPSPEPPEMPARTYIHPRCLRRQHRSGSP